MIVAKTFLKHKSEAGAVQDMLALYNLLDSEMFPSLKAVIQVALTIPVSSCRFERSFSTLHRLYTWLKRTTSQSRLQHPAVVSFEKELLERVEYQKVIKRFATLKVLQHWLTKVEGSIYMIESKGEPGKACQRFSTPFFTHGLSSIFNTWVNKVGMILWLVESMIKLSLFT